MIHSFLAVFRKEFLQIFRDKGTLIAALSIPVFQLILFGFIDQTVRHLRTVVVDQDRSSYSRELMDKMRQTQTFKITGVTSNSHEARQEIIAGRARIGVVIPPHFHDDRTRGKPAQILVLIDGSDSNASAQALGSINGLIADMNRDIAGIQSAKQPVAAQPIILFNPDGRTANYIIPGLVAVLLQIVAMVLAAVAIVRERERGTMEQLLVTPIDPFGLMMGKLFPYLVLGLGEMSLILLAMRFGFGVIIHGSLAFIYAMAVIYLFAMLSLGLFISTRAHSSLAAQQQAQLFFLPSIFLSGYIFPFDGFPWILRCIGQVLPATHMVAIMRGVVLRSAGFMDLLPHVLALAAFSVVMTWLSVSRFRKIAL